MARIKKNTKYDPSMPSLFDGPDFSTGLEESLPELPGLDRHVQTLKRKYESRFNHTVAPLEAVRSHDHVVFISFGSGSSGNCTYVGTRSSGVLIDAGVDNKYVEKELLRNGIDHTAVKGIILTHDHGDHIRYAYSLLRANKDWGLYCTPKVLNGILRRHNISRRIKDYHHAIYKEFPFELGGFEITAFEVSHDGSDNAGFFIKKDHFTFALATDLGSIGERVDYYMRQASHIMIETNYDCELLVKGRYPEYLKARIIAENGHLDNTDAASYLTKLYSKRLKHVFLCHLSKDNNTPEKALHAVNSALISLGVKVGDCSNSPAAMNADVQVMALPRFDSTGLITLERL
ncbi:MAG: MBL fold metallo-hydrolase [Muribaculaceae bacterium]|nr:MBL fold metallo-hydrolase [Muribaculaceae bacterium]